MAEQYTGPDALRLYLTGAVEDGGWQADPSISLGGYRSATEETQLAAHLLYPADNLRLDFVSGANGTGNASLATRDGGYAAWTAPGESQGAWVAIANGETKILTGATASKYARVTRTSASAISGLSVVRLSRVFNNAIGGANVTDAQRAAGVTTYRCLALKNVSAGNVTDIKIWQDSGNSGISIWAEATYGGTVSDMTVAGELVAPPGAAWNTGTSAGAGLQVGTLAAGAWVGLWIKRVTAAGAAATAKAATILNWSYAA